MRIVTVLCSVILLTSLTSYAQNPPTFDILEKSIDDFISDYRMEAFALVNMPSKITRKQLLIAMTKVLRNFRLSLSEIIDSVVGTRAELCVSNTSYKLHDVTTTPHGTITNVEDLISVSFRIADFYTYSFTTCTSSTLKQVNDNLNRIPGVRDSLKQLIRKGDIYIQPCLALPEGSYSPGINQTIACVEHYKASLQRLRTVFLNAIKEGEVKGEDLSKPGNNQNKDLFTIPNCLLDASTDAVETANFLLKDIRKCSETVGVNLTIKELPLSNISHIETALQYLSKYYDSKNINTLDISSNYAKLALFNSDLETGKKFRNRSQVVDSIFTETAYNATVLAASTNDEVMRNCLNSANSYLQENIADCDYALRECADTLLAHGNKLFRSYNNGLEVGKRNVNTPGNVATLAECLSTHLFNADALNSCFKNIYITQLEVPNQIDIKGVFQGDSIEYYCKERVYRPGLALEQLYNCGFPRP